MTSSRHNVESKSVTPSGVEVCWVIGFDCPSTKSMLSGVEVLGMTSSKDLKNVDFSTKELM